MRASISRSGVAHGVDQANVGMTSSTRNLMRMRAGMARQGADQANVGMLTRMRASISRSGATEIGFSM
jgi:hypothetical protein